MKNLIIIGVLLYVFSRKNTSPTINATTPPPTPKKTPVIIDNGGTGGGGGTTPTGAYVFEFFQQQNQSNLVSAQLVSHSRVATPVEQTPANATATSEYWIYGPDNELVVHVKDNVGGHHPNFFTDAIEDGTTELKARIIYLIQNFVGAYPFSSYQQRGNNHEGYFNRQLRAGTYRWVYKNTSNTKHRLFAGYTNSETENVRLNTISEPNSYNEYSIEVVPHPTDPNIAFKFNSNNYEL